MHKVALLCTAIWLAPIALAAAFVGSELSARDAKIVSLVAAIEQQHELDVARKLAAVSVIEEGSMDGIVETLTREMHEPALSLIRGSVRQCHEIGIVENVDVEGALVIRLRLDLRGDLVEAEVSASDVADSIGACVVGHANLRDLRFNTKRDTVLTYRVKLATM